MPVIKREFFIPCRGVDCFKLAELIQENVSIGEMAIDIRDNGLYIAFYGYKSDIRRAWARVKKVLRDYRSSIRRTPLGYRVSIDYIVSSIKKTFPPILLVEIVKRMGYSVRYSSGYIETDMDVEELKEIASKIADIVYQLRYEVRSTACKYFIVAASILTGREPSNVIDDAIGKELVYLDEDGKPRLRVEWRRAIDIYTKYVRGIEAGLE